MHLQKSRLSVLHPLLALAILLGSSSASLLRAAESNYGQIPVAFVANRGQVHHSVRFTTKSPGLTAYFTPQEVVLDVGSAVVRSRYLGANASPAVEGLDLQQGKANYLIGNDPGNWQTDVPLFGRVVYKDLYPGIDMLYSSSARRLKSQFVVAPGADPSRIQIAFTAVAAIRIDEAGRLIFTAPDGELRETAPVIYQEADGRRVPVKGAFRIYGDEVSFSVEEYDRSRELKIDSVLSAHLAGSGTNKGTAIAVDSGNAAYVTGYTDSTKFPVLAGQSSGAGVDVFVTKLNASGNAIVYTTYFGGSSDDRGFSIAVDESGNAYVTGSTNSTNFPAVASLQASAGGTTDAFVAKLNPAGSALVFSTYLGGSGNDSGNGIAIDGSGIYVTGSTTSANFPVLGAFQPALSGGQDGFVTKLNTAGSALVYSTYLGGSLDDRASSIAVDSFGSAYVAGNTSSTDFPIASALQPANAGAPDAFVTKLSADGRSLIYSTYVGGTGAENVELGRSIAVDSDNNVYVTGMTASTNFPTFQPMQGSLIGSNDAFVVKLNAAGTAFVYSTYLGGSSIDYGESIAVDGSGNAYVAGYTSSPDFPSVNANQQPKSGNHDAFIAKLNPAGATLVGTDFLRGSGADSGYGIALDSSASAYLTGQTSSSNSGLSTGSLGMETMVPFVAKSNLASGTPSAVSVSPSSGSGTSQTFNFVYADSSGNADIHYVEILFQTTISGQNACYVQYVPSSNTISLLADSGYSYVGAAQVGTAGTVSNSQCTLDAGASVVSLSGSNLTLTVGLAFKPAFSGAKSVYMNVFNNADASSGWQANGAWSVAGAPTNTSVTPASGSGMSQNFSFVYSDSFGYADIRYVEILFQTAISGQNACYVQYVPSTNTINLLADSGYSYVGAAQVGIAGTVSNSQCTLDAGASTVSLSGNNVTLTVALAFKTAFSGGKNAYMNVFNNSKVLSGWQAKGTWTVASTTTNTSVTPASGSGMSQNFSFVYSDSSGYAGIRYVEILFQTAISGQNACYVQYVPSNNTISLVSDSGTRYAGAGQVGVAGTISNSQCTLDAGASTVSLSGNNVTLGVALTFKPAFSGTKNAYMNGYNNTNALSGWQAKGTWTVVTAASTNVSVAPVSGSGTSHAFTFVYSDPYGYADIYYTEILFQSQVSGQNACYLQYVPSNNTISLVSDSGYSYAGAGQVGIAGTVSNSQCTVDAGASSVVVSGNNLTLTVALTFKPAFTGAKSSYMNVVNRSNVSSGFVAKGIWTAYGQSVQLTVASGAGSKGTTINIGISMAATGGVQPSVLQFTLSYSSTDISSVNIAADVATTGADKSILCSSSTGSTICMIYGVNNKTIASGSVAIASFQIASGSTATSIPIQISAVLDAITDGNSISAAGAGAVITVN